MTTTMITAITITITITITLTTTTTTTMGIITSPRVTLLALQLTTAKRQHLMHRTGSPVRLLRWSAWIAAGCGADR